MIFLDAWDSHWVNLMMLACAVILLNPETAADLRQRVFRKVLFVALVLMTAAQGVFLVHNMYIFRVAQLANNWTPEREQICTKYWEKEASASQMAAEKLMTAAIPGIDPDYTMRPILDDDGPIPLKDYIRSELESYFSRNEDLIEDEEYQAVRRDYKSLPEPVYTPYWDVFRTPWITFTGIFAEWSDWFLKNAYQISFFVLGLVCLTRLRTGNPPKNRAEKALLRQTDIVQIVSRYIPLEQRGDRYKAICPFHEEKTPSFIVDPEKQIFHCFGCGTGGDAIDFVQDYLKMDRKQAVEELKKPEDHEKTGR